MTNTNIFGALSDTQLVNLKEALSYITILVAGADGKIDEQELNWAEKLTHIRSYAEPQALNDFYGEVEQEFTDSISSILQKLPENLAERETKISAELSKLNEVLSCLENPIAFDLYKSFTSFAKHIAKASGGFLRFGSISQEEKQWIDLPMITPIVLEIAEEEE